jgi:hypothetical protein
MAPSTTNPKPDRRSKPSRLKNYLRKAASTLGFHKTYNLPLFLIFGLALIGFTLARLPYLHTPTFKSSTMKGEFFHYRQGLPKIGMTLHLGTILPASLLLVWQFVPVIRHNYLVFHRINGYIIILLVFISNAGALMIAHVAFGGGLAVQSFVGLLAIMVTVSIVFAWVNIKRLQIDQHRAWMLRAMFYLGSIITIRLIMILSALIVSQLGKQWMVFSCEKLAYIHGGNVEEVAMLYIGCAQGNGSAMVTVRANMFEGEEENVEAALGLSFGMAGWLAMFLHLIGVEIYLHLTGKEGERLRNVSYERQLEAGYEHPGSAGLTSDRWGDGSEFKPISKGAQIPTGPN